MCNRMSWLGSLWITAERCCQKHCATLPPCGAACTASLSKRRAQIRLCILMNVSRGCHMLLHITRVISLPVLQALLWLGLPPEVSGGRIGWQSIQAIQAASTMQGNDTRLCCVVIVTSSPVSPFPLSALRAGDRRRSIRLGQDRVHQKGLFVASDPNRKG